MPQSILIRDEESEWHRENQFTCWADVGLTEPDRAQPTGLTDAGERARYID